ncbi:ABC transporter permease [Actinospica durhamensis]|uniref:ABC transporter permease n=1 Tax=Actinospica durhamensis TaxID=1508375 RepID=A0A941INP5_9ACTN|nr:ABC transporter permease [Actinospica durhamensis]MBR7832257.1 ABC transporter permease [Actinospica durhamensis]
MRPNRFRLPRFLRNHKAAAGALILLFFLVFAVIGPWIAPYSPDQTGTAIVVGPSSAHWFGTDQLGRDIYSQLLVGTRGVVVVGFLAGAIATVLSMLIGIASGYLPGRGGESLSVLSNVFLVLPALPLLIIITSTQQSNGWVVILVIGLTSWAWNARLMRAQTLSLRRRDYIEAARATGESTSRIIVFEILPNLTALIASGFIGTVVFTVLTEITLAFVGISVSEWNWGTVLYWAQSQDALAQNAWWWFVPAGLAIALLGTGLALLNFGIDEFVNPRLRSSGPARIKTATGRRVRMRIGFTPVTGAPGELVPALAQDPEGETL